MSDEMPEEERKYMAFVAKIQAGKVEFDGDFPHPAEWARFEKEYAKEQQAMNLAVAVRSNLTDELDDWPAPNSWRDLVKAEQETTARQEQQAMNNQPKSASRAEVREAAAEYRDRLISAGVTRDASAAAERLQANEEETQAPRARLR